MATKEMKGMTDQELMERIQAEKADLNKLTFNHTISPVENPSKIRVQRRNIAKMLTEVNNRKKAAK
jgi:large subunit ribosomal protein L29